MDNNTRQLFDQYIARQAQLNGVSTAAIAAKFAVDPTRQQRLEQAAQENDSFLSKINVFGVNQQIGQKVLIGSKGPMAGVNNSVTSRRNPGSNHSMEPFDYMCRKVNYDYGISYEQLDAWAHMPEFQPLISKAMARQMSLDRIMIGFNGVKYSDPSDRAANPLLQDCGIGWLEKIRQEAPHRVISNVTITSRDEDNKIVAKGTYGNIGAAVYDAKNSLMDEWHKRNPDNVVILAGDLADEQQFLGHQRIKPDQPEYRNAGRSAYCRAGARRQYADLYRALLPGKWRADHAVQKPVGVLPAWRSAPDDQRRAGIQPCRNVSVVKR